MHRRVGAALVDQTQDDETQDERHPVRQQLENPVAVAARNTIMRLTPPRLALRSMARYADWHRPAPARP